jgi:hypothetical protein
MTNIHCFLFYCNRLTNKQTKKQGEIFIKLMIDDNFLFVKFLHHTLNRFLIYTHNLKSIDQKKNNSFSFSRQTLTISTAGLMNGRFTDFTFIKFRRIWTISK